jgi:DNA-binding MarR family transcriptional regulator
MAEPLDHLVVVRLWALMHAFEARLSTELGSFGLTLAGFRLIGELMRSPEGVSQSELARRLRVRPPTVSTSLSRLEAAGLIERTEDPADPRAYLVRLVPDASLGRGVDLLERLEAELIGELALPEREQLVALLDRVGEALQPDVN